VTVLEAGAVADKSDEVGCGDRAPAGLGGRSSSTSPVIFFTAFGHFAP
jgi:hypothetical protein